jgi:hypothetical protein
MERKTKICDNVETKQMGLPTSVSSVAAFNSETSLLTESFVPFWCEEKEGKEKKAYINT